MANEAQAPTDLPKQSDDAAVDKAAEPRRQADDIDEDDPHKAEKLAQAGRDLDTDAGSD